MWLGLVTPLDTALAVFACSEKNGGFHLNGLCFNCFLFIRMIEIFSSFIWN